MAARRKDRHTELFAADGLRTGESKQYSAALYLRKRLCIESLVSFQRFGSNLVMLCECRRVENYQIEITVHSVKIVERILANGLMRCIRSEIKRNIFRCKSYGTLRTVHRHNLRSTSCKSINRKAARITERIEHSAP